MNCLSLSFDSTCVFLSEVGSCLESNLCQDIDVFYKTYIEMSPIISAQCSLLIPDVPNAFDCLDQLNFSNCNDGFAETRNCFIGANFDEASREELVQIIQQAGNTLSFCEDNGIDACFDAYLSVPNSFPYGGDGILENLADPSCNLITNVAECGYDNGKQRSKGF